MSNDKSTKSNSHQCLANPPSLSSTFGIGNIQQIAGLSSYVTGSHDLKRAIILVSDVFGYEAPKLRKLADKIATVGKFLVVVPDFFYGSPFGDPNVNIESCLKDHSLEKGSEDAKQVIVELRNRGISSIGAAGFCWGGWVVVKLASDVTNFDAAVLLHPGLLKDEDINEVKVHIAILGAEIDKICPAEVVKHAGEILSANLEFDSFVKIFPGVAHGWTVRYKDEDEFAVKSAEEAHLDLLNWLTKYVK